MKPDRRIYELAFTRLGVRTRASVLFVATAPTTSCAGRATSGMTPVLSTTGRSRRLHRSRWDGARVTEIPQVLASSSDAPFESAVPDVPRPGVPVVFCGINPGH